VSDGFVKEERKARATPWLSLDGWAVVLALALSLAVWVGLIKRVPW
jgi:hypothetical protein